MNRRSFILSAGGALVAGAAPAEPLPQKERIAVRFGIVTDLHSGDLPSTQPPHEIRAYRESLGKFRECIAAMNARKVDFVIELGDFIEYHRTREKSLAALDAVERVFAGFKGPRYHVFGNHDLQTLTRDDFLSHVENTGIAKDQSYYRFETGGIAFLVLDHGYYADGSAMVPGHTDWQRGHLAPAEREWLAREIAAAKGPVILFSHWRLDPEGGGGLQALDAGATRKLFAKHPGKVLASFNGHDHYASLVVSNDILYYGLRGMITGSGATMNGYAVVSVYDSGRIEVDGYRRAQSAMFARTIRHPCG